MTSVYSNRSEEVMMYRVAYHIAFITVKAPMKDLGVPKVKAMRQNP